MTVRTGHDRAALFADEVQPTCRIAGLVRHDIKPTTE
jgi:hypothetical protein